jgi:hypothetical protein
MSSTISDSCFGTERQNFYNVNRVAMASESGAGRSGQAVEVSADSLSDEETATTFYKADVEIDPTELARLDGVSLYPGMPAEVLHPDRRPHPCRLPPRPGPGQLRPRVSGGVSGFGVVRPGPHCSQRRSIRS